MSRSHSRPFSMTSQEPDGSPTSKRRKLDRPPTDAGATRTIMETRASATEEPTSKSLSRPISPPLSRRRASVTPSPSTPHVQATVQTPKQTLAPALIAVNYGHKDAPEYIPSPIQLTRVEDLSPDQNIGTISLNDILGDPMIRECWNFNFLFDIDFVMDKFDPDVRSLVELKLVHGFWKRDDERRIRLMETAEQYPNIELISAYMPDPFGTHHSKILILLRHDELAQVIIHTANMISRDWGNMTQAIWRSPLLPLQPHSACPPGNQTDSYAHMVGSGERFKTDLFRYLNAYGKRLSGLTAQLVNYDFSTIRAAFIGSTPSRQKPSAANPAIHTSWGWLGVHEILSTIPIEDTKSLPNVVIQVSSIATLGQTPAWLTHFQSVLNCSSTTSSSLAHGTASATSSTALNFFTKRERITKENTPDTKFNIIFPTPHEIRTSLDGYNSGGSIHTKLQSTAQQKQLQYLRPMLCHWKHEETGASSSSQDAAETMVRHREAHRGAAAPHIKTYIRFSGEEQQLIDWAMVTSANLSKQAWGETENKKGEIWIQSWECGVVIWPDIFKSSRSDRATMVPMFGKDLPGEEAMGGEDEEEKKKDRGLQEKGKLAVVGFRMPYDLPLVPYKENEVPWCATAAHDEPDWKGQVWPGYQPHA